MAINPDVKKLLSGASAETLAAFEKLSRAKTNVGMWAITGQAPVGGLDQLASDLLLCAIAVRQVADEEKAKGA